MGNQNNSELTIESRFNSSDYQLIEKIGEGGFGQVYKAIQLNTQQFVAIKLLMLNPEFDIEKRQRYIERFERETLLGSHLQHPNIVRLLDKGQCDSGLIYAVFEYVEGQSLKEKLIDVGALMPLEAAEVMAQVLDAIAHAHKQGVIHRDIKPANIMLTTMGAKTHAKILDFGIGTLIQEVRQLDFKSITLTQESLGTPSYCAPEQLRGEPPTPKTDLYVWGLVFIECLTGRPAISGANLASIFHKQLNSSNVPLPAAIAGHPVAALLRRVLQKKTNERAASATDVYKEFIGLNFSSLVGDLSSKSVKPELTYNSASMDTDNDQTLINDHSTHQSGLIERKQITVLCLSISVMSVSQEKMDLEIIDALHRDQKTQSVDIAIRYGAYHVGTLGDTLLFYFGYPVVSDNDPRLCARTALEIISNINKSNSLRKHSQGIIAEAHIGMHTGIVTAYADTTPEGYTPNIAMELTRIALPNQILCSDASRKILDSYIEFEPFEVRTMGGDSREMPIYLLTGERQVEALGFLRASRQNYEFIGREKELSRVSELITTIANDKGSGAPALVHISGEAGIGKSRLIFELRACSLNFNHYVAQCLPEFKNSALYPILNLIKNKYSLDSLTPEAAILLLRNEINNCPQLDETKVIPVLSSWFGYPLPDDLVQNFDTADQQKQILFDAITVLIGNSNDEVSRPNLIFFEDIHWVDPTSIEFITKLAKGGSLIKSGIAIIFTSRQPLTESMADLGCHSVELLRLNNDKTEEFLINLFGNKKLSANLIEVIVSRTDGIPLFIEELVNMLKQKGLVQHLNGITDFVNLEKIEEVPESLRDSLQQKLDSLPNAKETAQVAATIGREFNYDLLSASFNCSEEQLQANLNELIENELVYLQRKVVGDSYIFKHALVRDAAYDSMTEVGRRDVHLNIANAIETSFATILEQSPFELARHFAAAFEYKKAIKYETVSAKKSLDISASKDCINHCKNLYAWSNELEEHERDKEHLNASILMTLALMNKDGWAGEEVSTYANKCLKLVNKIYFNSDEYGFNIDASESLDQDLIAQLVQIYYALILHNIVSGNRKELKNLEDKLLDDVVNDLEKVLTLTKNPSLESAALAILGYYYYTKGDFDIAVVHLENSVSRYRLEFDNNHGITYGFDSRVWAAATLGLLFWLKDQNDRANHYMQLAIDAGHESGHMPSLCIALMYKCILRQYQQDAVAVREASDELIEKATKYNLPAHLTYGLVIHYWALNETENLSIKQRKENLVKAEEPVAGLKNMGCFHAVPYFESLLADIELSLGLTEDANRRFSDCIELCHSIGEHYYHPMLPYRKSFVEDKLGDSSAAVSSLNDALTWAEKTTMDKVSTLVMDRLKLEYQA